MKPRKPILTLAISLVVITAACIVYSLSPTIRNVSGNPALHEYLNKPLELKAPAKLITCERGAYDLIPIVLVSETHIAPGKLTGTVAVGSIIVIRDFKTYTNTMEAGITYLYALGQHKLENGSVVDFAYNLGQVGPSISQPLKLTLWQDSTSQPILFYEKP